MLLAAAPLGCTVAPAISQRTPGLRGVQAQQESQQESVEDDSDEEPQEESEILEKRRGGLEDGIAPVRFFPETRFYWDQGPRIDLLGGDLSLVFGRRPRCRVCLRAPAPVRGES